MTAEEARKLMERRKQELSGQDEVIYNNIMLDIRDTINSSKKEVYSIYSGLSINDYVKQRLIRDGFKVEYLQSFRNESSTKISWDN